MGLIPLPSTTKRIHKDTQGYLAHIGRFGEDKGAHRSIEIARRSGMPLIIAGTTNNHAGHEEYFAAHVQPHITVTDKEFLSNLVGRSRGEVAKEIAKIQCAHNKKAVVIFVGEANENEKQILYGGAEATLFPISWSEPFGRVLIESMAAGTPVIAYRKLGQIDTGSVKEIVDEGITGYMVDGVNEESAIAAAVEAVGRIKDIDRFGVRQRFDEKWSSERNAIRLDELYQRCMDMRLELYTHAQFTHRDDRDSGIPTRT